MGMALALPRKGGGKLLLEKSTWPAVEAYFANSDLVVLGFGSTENHGRHNPLGTDWMAPQRIMDLMGERRPEVLYGPTLRLGSADHFIDDQADVERRTPVDDGLGVLGDLVVEDLGCRAVAGMDGVLVAHGDAAAAAHAAVVVDARHVDLALLSAGKLELEKGMGMNNWLNLEGNEGCSCCHKNCPAQGRPAMKKLLFIAVVAIVGLAVILDDGRFTGHRW